MNKYNLPTNHRLFTTRTQGSLMLEMLEDLFVRRAEIKRELTESSGVASVHASGKLLESLWAIEEILGERRGGPMVTGDPLIDRWERQIADGEKPDLTETVGDLRERGEL